MNAAQQHFWDCFYGWSLGIGSIITVILIVWFVLDERLHSPFAPFIRAYERRQAHKQRIQLLKTQAQLAKSGIDPEYITFMQQKLEEK